MVAGHWVGIALVLLLVVVASVLAGRQVHTANDFQIGGRRASAPMVTGALVGTLVGGASTIGTAQLAYTQGMVAWLFTLGGGISLLIMVVFFSRPFSDSGLTTAPAMIGRAFGKLPRSLCALLAGSGSFLSVVSQMLSGVALLTALGAWISPLAATAATVVLIMAYVLFGGAIGASYVGIVKTLTLALSIGACALIAMRLGGGLGTMVRDPSLPPDYFSLLSRGVAVDLGALASIVVGILTEQAYLQALIGARTVRTGRVGALTAAVVIPTIGSFGVVVGLYMRLHRPGITSSMALPLFIMENVPSVFAGVMLATLLVALVGTGAGLALGVSTVIYNDLVRPALKKTWGDRTALWSTRGLLLAVLIAAAVISMAAAGGVILNYAVLSMGLRGSVAFAPLLAALFWRERVPAWSIILAMVTGPTVTILGTIFLSEAVNWVVVGAASGLAIIALGALVKALTGTPDQVAGTHDKGAVTTDGP